MDKEWEKFGRDIRAIVEDAVNTQDFRQLNKTITNTINEAVNSIQDGLKTAGDAVNQAVSQSFSENRNQKEWQEKNPKNQHGHFSQSFSENPGERGWKERNHKNQYGHFSQSFSENRSGREWQEKNPNTKPELFKKNTSVKVGGIVLTACGWTFGVGFGIAVVVLMLVGMFLGSFNIGIKIALSILFPFLAGCGIMAWKGNGMLSALKRYRGYIAGLHGRTYCNIKELAEKSGKSFHFVLKDVKKMIDKGWFRQGHLDHDKTCLIVSHDTYQEYQSIQKQRIEQKEREQQRQPQVFDPEDASVNPEVQKVISEGKEYIRKIQTCNQAIPGEEISRKISRMEVLIQKIFDRVKEDPDSLEDISKLMEYYLPTTVKLLEAYQQLESQPVQGENIRNSKEEIEQTLDTLNVAFEKLLDSLFEDVAWDVSSDISVLHTMLAQEGLTKDDFKV